MRASDVWTDSVLALYLFAVDYLVSRLGLRRRGTGRWVNRVFTVTNKYFKKPILDINKFLSCL